MAEIDVAIFAFDSERRLVLVNRFGERLLGRDRTGSDRPPRRRARARSARSAARRRSGPQLPGRRRPLGDSPHASSGRAARRTSWCALSDLSQPLREQERQAWQRLIRVIGHELNNSLAPIKSIAGSLESLLGRDNPPDDWRDDMRSGLAVIGSRADALSRFTTAYARLARLPRPSWRPSTSARSCAAWSRWSCGCPSASRPPRTFRRPPIPISSSSC